MSYSANQLMSVPGLNTTTQPNQLAPQDASMQPSQWQFDPAAAMQWLQQQMQGQQQAQTLQQTNPGGIDPATMAALQYAGPAMASLGALGGVPNPYAGVGPQQSQQQPWWALPGTGQGAETGPVGGAQGNQAAAGVGTNDVSSFW